MSTVWIPRTPAGTDCLWISESTEARAWQALMKDASHMPYGTKAAFIKRGYTVNEWTVGEAKEST